MLQGMNSEPVETMHCCGEAMSHVASAERGGHKGGVHRVTVYRCERCNRTDSRGESCDPWWVGAKARMFLELRREAFQSAGLEASEVVAVFGASNRQVIFG